jgi:hypothetical protein
VQTASVEQQHDHEQQQQHEPQQPIRGVGSITATGPPRRAMPAVPSPPTVAPLLHSLADHHNINLDTVGEDLLFAAEAVEVPDGVSPHSMNLELLDEPDRAMLMADPEAATVLDLIQPKGMSVLQLACVCLHFTLTDIPVPSLSPGHHIIMAAIIIV